MLRLCRLGASSCLFGGCCLDVCLYSGIRIRRFRGGGGLFASGRLTGMLCLMGMAHSCSISLIPYSRTITPTSQSSISQISSISAPY